jgi:hypothetical protein
MELFILAIAIGALFTTLVAILVLLTLVFFLYKSISSTEVLVKIMAARGIFVERLLTAIFQTITSEGAPGPQDASIIGATGIIQKEGKFVTEDGRHVADTFEELMHKISQDPRYRVAKEEDIDKLRQAFEKNIKDDDDENDDDDDIPDLPGDEWKKEK